MKCAASKTASHALACLSIAALLLATGCATQVYAPRPVDLAAASAETLAFRPDSDETRALLARQGIDVSVWPLAGWDEPALLAMALARQPELAVARAELAAAQAAAVPARLALGGAELTLEHLGGPSESPWTLGLVLDMLFTGEARRRAEAEGAAALADEAVQRAAEAAWATRQRLRQALRDLVAAESLQRADEAVLAEHRAVVAALRSRFALGAIDARELAVATQAELESQRVLLRSRDDSAQARLRLAAALHLAPEALAALPLAPLAEAAPKADDTLSLQRAALLNRLDLRAALARHAQAEAALKREIARQWPELVFKPGFAWDQGEPRWSFGLALSLPPGGDNRAAVERARAERELSAQRALALQAQALARLDEARAALASAQAQRQAADAFASQAHDDVRRVERSLAAGSADRLDVALARRTEAAAERLRLEAQAQDARARSALEDALQLPLPAAARAESTPKHATDSALARSAHRDAPGTQRPAP